MDQIQLTFICHRTFLRERDQVAMQPGRLDADFSFFVMESGEITWSQGQVNVGRLEVDVTTLGRGGLPDGQYKAGYLMGYAQPETPPSWFCHS